MLALSSEKSKRRTMLEQFSTDESVAFSILDSIDPTLVLSAEDKALLKNLKNPTEINKKNKLFKKVEGKMRNTLNNYTECPASLTYKCLAKLQLSDDPSKELPNEVSSENLLDKLHNKMTRLAPKRQTVNKEKEPIKSNSISASRKTKNTEPSSKLSKKRILSTHTAQKPATSNHTEFGNDEKNDISQESNNTSFFATQAPIKFGHLKLSAVEKIDELQGKTTKKRTKANLESALAFARSAEAQTDKSKWTIAQMKAAGDKVVPSEKISKLLKARQVKKKRSSKAWSARDEQVKMKRQKKSEKRAANLNKRKQAKIQKKKKRLARKGHIV